MKKVGMVLVVLVALVIVILLFLIPSIDNDDATKKQNKSIGDESLTEKTSTVRRAPTEEEIIGGLVADMSLDEKVGQLIIAGLDGQEMTEATRDFVESYHVGGFIFFQPNLQTPDQAVQLVNDVKKLNQANDIPLFLAVDQEGGRVTRLPGIDQMKTNGEIGASYDTNFSYQTGKLLASQLHAYGLQVNFAPSVDIHSNAHNQVIGDRAFGDNPAIVSEHGVQMMKAMQEENIITSIKHFPGHGDTYEDSHHNLPIIDKTEEKLQEMELIPFQKAIDEGADMVMIAHILLPAFESEYPATLSKPVVTNLLREKMGYDGVVVTDDMTMGAIANKFDPAEASVKAIKAGVDIILMAHGNEHVVATFTALKTAVEVGDISKNRLDESVTRILSLKRKYHLTDTPVEKVDINQLNEDIHALYTNH